MDVAKLGLELERFLHDQRLWQPDNLAGRAEALAFVSYLRQVARARRHLPAMVALYEEATRYAQQWTAITEQIVADARHRIATGEWRGAHLRPVLDRYTAYRPGEIGADHLDHDGLDVWVRGVFAPQPAPPETLSRGPEMVHLEQTPARVLLELVDRVSLTSATHFFDLGSGLGQLVLLFHFLTGLPATGVEIEPAYVGYARRRAVDLGDGRVTFLQADARTADLYAGTLFFLFTPFTGDLLQTVLERLCHVAQHHPIHVAAYGSCASPIARQRWLQPLDDHAEHPFKLALFGSR